MPALSTAIPILQQVQDERKKGNRFQDERMGGGGPRYRHSRVSGNPAVDGCNGLVFSVPFGIPAYAGMTVGGGGKDGREGGGKDGCDGCYCLFGIPAYAGRTVGAAGRE